MKIKQLALLLPLALLLGACGNNNSIPSAAVDDFATFARGVYAQSPNSDPLSAIAGLDFKSGTNDASVNFDDLN